MTAHALLAAALLIAGSLPARAQEAAPGPPPPTITAERLSGTPNVIIVDARRAEHWQGSAHQIAGARRGTPDAVVPWSRELSPQAMIVVYCDCPGAATSARVAQELARQGFGKVYVLEGGWSGWSAGGFPVEPRRL